MSADEASDWTEKVDKRSGQTYYVNRKTRASQWTTPDALLRKQTAEARGEAASDWIQKTDPKSGKAYYVNIKTKHRQWKMPEVLLEQKLQDAKPKE